VLSVLALSIAVVLGYSYPQPLLVFVFGLAATALVSEIVVYGLEGVANTAGLESKTANMVVNVLGVIPELFLGISIGLKGVRSGNVELVEFSVLTMLVSAVAILLTLSLIVVAARGVVFDEAYIVQTSSIVRAGIAAFAIAALYAVVEAGFAGVEAKSPPELSIALAGFFIVYIVVMVRRGRTRPYRGGIARPLLVMLTGLGGLVLASETIASVVEELVGSLSLGTAALVVGVVGVLPEAIMNALLALRGRAGEAVAGLIAAAASVALLVYGVLSLVLPVIVYKYHAYMLGLIAVSMWLLLDSMETENCIDVGEAVIALLLQVSGLILLVHV
jgi:Ca2+/Na+ antiporter